ncbi:hypothetical protein LJC71_06490 [Desulfosarcina sp. OttesenSCG-928-A07]|nr:hypothetical protein [Desulfosarcina sp. OttesenSCG-928-A07]
MTKPNDLYTMAHVFVSAVRILEYRDGVPPSLAAVCRLLDYSSEKGGYLLARLLDLGILTLLKSGFNDRIGVADHLAIENLPRDTEETRLSRELKKFKAEKQVMEDKVAAIKAQQDQKKQDRFAEIEKKLKQKIEQNKS